MNWKRIWTGGLLAGMVLFLVNGGLQAGVLIYRGGEALNLTVLGLWVLPSFIEGIILSGLYALARPRLGPGPKTALLMGSVIALLLSASLIGNFSAWIASPFTIFGHLFFMWLKYVAATYLAGWQYIEKAPS